MGLLDSIGSTTFLQGCLLLLLPPVFEVDTTSTLIDMYKNYPWGDLWWESGLTEVAQYLRVSKKISIPAEWREILPDYVLDEPMED